MKRRYVTLLALLLVPPAWLVLEPMGQRPAVEPRTFLSLGEEYQARIRRDTWGVPHIRGVTSADAAFGLAYAHCEDDFPTIHDVLLATRGQLAAEKGRDAAVGDYLVRLLDVESTVESGYQALPAELRAVLEGYADGVNYYVARHPSAASPALLPVTGQDIAAGFVFKTPFFYGLDRELRRLTEAEPDPLPKGSNAVALAPSRSAEGATRLLVNSHQPFEGPVAWYEAVVQSDDGWHVAGGFFPGSPFMLHGHNAHLAWANTVNAPDLVDVYRLEVDPADASRYLLDGQWRQFERTEVGIRVRLWGPFRWTFKREVLRSVHGPVLVTANGHFALRYAGMGEYRQALQYWRLNRARNRQEWQSAMAMLALPSINYLYADEAGNIGYVYNGQFPDRTAGTDWSGLLPGDQSRLVWEDYLPFESVPQLWNPASGLLFNANNTPFVATGGDDGLRREDFLTEMGIQQDMTNRAWRILETYGADLSITEREFRDYKYDLAYSTHSATAGVVRELLAGAEQASPGLKPALDLLATWDLRADQGNRAAALAVLTATEVIKQRDLARQEVVPMQVLDHYVSFLTQHYGRIDPEWGEVNRLRRGSIDLPVDGAPDVVRAIYGVEDEDGRLRATAGDTMVMFVSWDRDGRLSSEVVHQFGSATSLPESQHYADQAPLFAGMRTRPVLFSEEQLTGQVVEDYLPGER
ncbi:MAG: acylase [Steroidobacteraceae bacterium]